jgi:tRNA threonylcarbamoyladenosine biosynthesis protein TsaE
LNPLSAFRFPLSAFSIRNPQSEIRNPKSAMLMFSATNESDTARLGAALAQVLPAGTTIGLIGTLGAGKTRLVQAVADALEVAKNSVTSPTFVLVNEYQGQMPIYHFDTYRLRDEDEFLELGPDEYFEGVGLTFVEWADRFPVCMPRQRLTIRIEIASDAAREFSISAESPQLEPVIEKLAALLTTDE